mgnify:CR=1 FL=1
MVFKPNTLTYAVPAQSDLATDIVKSDIGIVWHTAYDGETVGDMTAQFGASIEGLNDTPDVWFDDAYIKDFSGMATMTAQESEAVENAIADAQKHLKKLNKRK